MKSFIPFLLAVVLCAGCSTQVSVHEAPKVDLTQFRRVFVEQPLNENHHIDEMMVNELRALGIDATSGPLTMLPDKAQAVVTYNARWAGDFKISLVDLGVIVHTPETNKTLAEARYYQPSAFPKNAAAVVHSVITKLFTK